MSDVQARPAASRGRGSGRGGRGGFTSRGGRNASRSAAAAATNGDPKHDLESTALPTLEDQGEIGDLNKTYGSKVSLIKEVFPDWSEVDILYALKETDGDETSTIERIADGERSHHLPRLLPALVHIPSSPSFCPVLAFAAAAASASASTNLTRPHQVLSHSGARFRSQRTRSLRPRPRTIPSPPPLVPILQPPRTPEPLEVAEPKAHVAVAVLLSAAPAVLPAPDLRPRRPTGASRRTSLCLSPQRTPTLGMPPRTKTTAAGLLELLLLPPRVHGTAMPPLMPPLLLPLLLLDLPLPPSLLSRL